METCLQKVCAVPAAVTRLSHHKFCAPIVNRWTPQAAPSAKGATPTSGSMGCPVPAVHVAVMQLS